MKGFDLFGLKKDSPADGPAPAPAAARPPLPPKFWKGAAAADGVLLAACLGLVGFRVQGHLAGPAVVAPPRPAPVKKAEPKPEPKPEAPKEPEAKKPEPKKPEPKPEAKPEPKPDSKKPPLGSPAVHAAPAPKREPAPVGAKPAAAPPPPSFAAKKAATRPVPFSYEEDGAKEVYLVGPFLVRSGGRKTMFKDSRGVWQTTVYLNIGQTYKYRFEVVGASGKKLTPARSVEVLEAE